MNIIKTYTEVDALYSLASHLPNYQFVEGDGVIHVIDQDVDDGIVGGLYTSNTVSPFTQAEITAEVTRLQAEYDANQYQRDRATAYPSLQDQADMQFHDLANGTTTWLDAIQAVKDTYPKPI